MEVIFYVLRALFGGMVQKIRGLKMPLIYNYRSIFKQCDGCGHYFPGNKIARWDSGFTVVGPQAVVREEIVHTWWLCQDCYNGQLAYIESSVNGFSDKPEPGYEERTRGYYLEP